MKSKRKSRFIRYLLYIAVISTVVTSVTLSRYAQTISGEGARAVVAAFAGDSIAELEILLDAAMKPGDTQEIYFTVVNYKEEVQTEVAVDYSIEVVTTGNLPLSFELTGEKQDGDNNPMSVVAGPLNQNLKAEGGMMPHGEAIDHEYTLLISWDPQMKDEGYMYEIDMLTVKVNTVQQAPG